MRAHVSRSSGRDGMMSERVYICNGHLLDFRDRLFSLLAYAVYARRVEIRETKEKMKVKLAGYSVKDDTDESRGIIVLIRQRKTGANDGWDKDWVPCDIWRGMMLKV